MQMVPAQHTECFSLLNHSHFRAMSSDFNPVPACFVPCLLQIDFPVATLVGSAS